MSKAASNTGLSPHGMRYRLKSFGRHLSRSSSPDQNSASTSNVQTVIKSQTLATAHTNTKITTSTQTQTTTGSSKNLVQIASGFSQASTTSPTTSQAPAIILTSYSPITSANHPLSSLPVNSEPTLWEKAVNSLSAEDQHLFIIPGHGKLDVLQDVKELTSIKMKLCEEKQWKLQWTGKTIIVRDLANKVLFWVAKFKEIGDTVVQFDTGMLLSFSVVCL